LALRFTNDHLCRRERLDSYENILGNKLIRVEILSPDPAHQIGSSAHAVLTQELSKGLISLYAAILLAVATMWW
jgi:hypothetical protein